MLRFWRRDISTFSSFARLLQVTVVAVRRESRGVVSGDWMSVSGLLK